MTTYERQDAIESLKEVEEILSYGRCIRRYDSSLPQGSQQIVFTDTEDSGWEDPISYDLFTVLYQDDDPTRIKVNVGSAREIEQIAKAFKSAGYIVLENADTK